MLRGAFYTDLSSGAFLLKISLFIVGFMYLYATNSMVLYMKGIPDLFIKIALAVAKNYFKVIPDRLVKLPNNIRR